MPEYLYKCHSCGERFSRVLAMSERKDVSCDCGGEVSIVPQRTVTHVPLWWKPDRGIPAAEVKEKSGLVIQGERDGF